MIDVEIGRNSSERLALAAFAAMESGTFTEFMRAFCTADFVWANSGLRTLNGQAEVLAQIARGGFADQIPILKSMASFSADLIHIASNGNVVFTERIDHHWDAQGRDLMTPHITGVIEIRDGKIAALRDFYDTACYQQEPSAPDPAHAMPPG